LIDEEQVEITGLPDYFIPECRGAAKNLLQSAEY
jgi:hypothetical protein